MPGCVMAMARLNRPAVFVYGGTIQPGREAPRHRLGVRGGRRRTRPARVSDAELLRGRAHRDPGPGQLRRHVHRQHHGVGDRGAGPDPAEQLGAGGRVGDAKRDDCRRAGAAVVELIERGITPRDILTRKAFENAITVTHRARRLDQRRAAPARDRARGGGQLALDDFTRIGKRVPVLADLRPSGRYLMSELIAIGGIQPLMKTLLDAACCTATA